VRAQHVALQAKRGVAAPTGTEIAPSPDPGWIAIATVNVDNGAPQIGAAAITAVATAPRAAFKLPYLRPGFSAAQVFAASGVFTVPAGVTIAKVTVVGGGGAGGLHQTLPSAGGGAGGRAVKVVSGLVPGQQVPVTVGAGGQPPAAGTFATGGAGGTSSFGTFASATGGQGGAGGTAAGNAAGGSSGIGVGGDLNDAGSWGTDSVPPATRGGDGGGPGGGRGSSGAQSGMAAPGYGGGGGGGGASAVSGGTGSPGGAGRGGLVFVEF
jgi:hypothetical protein